jgi:D-proline reductase (dithiol) PrdB
VCNRSGGLVARVIEEAGIPTVLVMMYKGVAEKLRPPRVAHVRFPFGRPLGEPDNSDQQRVVIEDALGILETATKPGMVVSLPYRWRREDYAQVRRERGARPAGA